MCSKVHDVRLLVMLSRVNRGLKCGQTSSVYVKHAWFFMLEFPNTGSVVHFESYTKLSKSLSLILNIVTIDLLMQLKLPQVKAQSPQYHYRLQAMETKAFGCLCFRAVQNIAPSMIPSYSRCVVYTIQMICCYASVRIFGICF